MKDFEDYIKLKKQEYCKLHKRVVAIHGNCSKLDDREYERVKHGQKKAYAKSKRHVYTGYWRRRNEKFNLTELTKMQRAKIS